jgi:hypothetical protein
MRQAELELAQATAGATSIDDALDRLELEARRRLRDLQDEFRSAERARPALVALTDGERLRLDVADGRFRVTGSVGVSGLLRPDNAAADCVASPGRFETVGSALAAAGPLRLRFAA